MTDRSRQADGRANAAWGRVRAVRVASGPERSGGRSRPFPGRPLRVLRALGKFTTLAVLIGFWQFVSTVWLPSIDPYKAVLMPPPTAILVTAARMIASGELFHHLLASLKRELVAFAVAALAIPIGIAMGGWRWIYDQLNPILEVLRPIPPLAWIPLSILWFGIGDEQNEFIILLGMFFPILVNTIMGVRNVEQNLVRAAQCHGAGRWDVLRRVVFPAALPQIVTGVRVGLGVGWMALVAAELVGANSGLGFLINDARSMLRTDIILVGMLAIGLVGLLLDAAIREAARRLLPWSRAMAG